MMIWVYKELSREPEYVWSKETCTFCQTPLQLLHSTNEDLSNVKARVYFQKRVFVCSACGWWKAEGRKDVDDIVHRLEFQSTYGAAASLRELDLSDVSTPIEDVQSYLVARYEKRFTLHPRLFEETVASVFSQLGYRAETTAYSGDGGIDVILRRGDETIGLQVKRYRGAIQVEQIRSFAGALMLGGMTRGIFVTTSTFQRGARPTTEAASTQGYKVELLNAEQFYDALKVAQRTMYGSFEDFPVAQCLDHLVMIEDRVEDRERLRRFLV